MSFKNHKISLLQAYPTFYPWDGVYPTNGLFEKGDDLTCNFVLYIAWIDYKFEEKSAL